MPSSTGESPRVQHDRDRLSLRTALAEPRHIDEPRHFDVLGAEIATHPSGPHAGYDADLNPIDDELINSHGSER